MTHLLRGTGMPWDGRSRIARRVGAPKPPPPVSITESTSAKQPAPAPPISPLLHISDEILRACSIRFSNIEGAPQFDFDRSELRDRERDVLAQVASCLTTGPLQGRKVHLTGRADPRGETECNFALGASRAGSVRDYLMRLGVDATKVSESSRGELDATGTDEATWQLDRRVDLDLAE